MAEEQLTQQQVLEQLRTRGFDSGFPRNPLRYFRGKVDSITGTMVQRGNMAQPRLHILYNFSDVQVFQSTEPYTDPIAQIEVPQSTREKSAMGVLGASIDRILNKDIPAEEPAMVPGPGGTQIPNPKIKGQEFIVGKIQDWKMTPGHLMWDGQKETPRESWETLWIEGVGGTPYTGAVEAEVVEASPSISPKDQAIALLDSKTQKEWNETVFTNATVRSGGGDLLNQIISGALVKEALESKRVTKDANGVFHLA